MGILGTIGKPQGVLKPERLIHLGAFCDQPIIKCGGFLPSASGQCLVGEGHHKVAFVILRGFYGAPIGGGANSPKRATSIAQISIESSPSIIYSAIVSPTPPPSQNPAMTPTATQ